MIIFAHSARDAFNVQGRFFYVLDFMELVGAPSGISGDPMLHVQWYFFGDPPFHGVFARGSSRSLDLMVVDPDV